MLREKYRAIADALSRVDFGALYPGFHLYRFALYDAQSICLEGRILPYDPAFRGCTSIEYEGEQMAIWNEEMVPIDDIEYHASQLVHEMFHAFQEDMGWHFDVDELAFLRYPKTMENLASKCQEARMLVAARGGDEEAWKAFAGIRAWRLSRCPDFVRQEIALEELEGSAEYIGLKALRMLHPGKYGEAMREQTEIVRDLETLCTKPRRYAYAMGVLVKAQAEARTGRMDALHWETVAPLAPEALSKEVREELQRCLDAVRAQEDTLRAKIARSERIPLSARLVGFDPMNMEAIDGGYFCRHFSLLRLPSGETRTLSGAHYLFGKDDAPHEVTGHCVFDGDADQEEASPDLQ